MTPELAAALQRGQDQFDEAFDAAQPDDTEGFIRDLGILGLTYVIQRVLDSHYPADIFGSGAALYPSWASEHGGEDIDHGIKWVAFLRHAIREVDR